MSSEITITGTPADRLASYPTNIPDVVADYPNQIARIFALLDAVAVQDDNLFIFQQLWTYLDMFEDYVIPNARPPGE